MPNFRYDFLKKNDVGEVGAFENMVEDELGALDRLWPRGLDIPGCEGKALPADIVNVCWSRKRRSLLDWGMRIAQRYGSPAIADVVERREHGWLWIC